MLHPEMQKKGIGTKILLAIENEYLTDDSEQFHNKMGFEIVGRHDGCGYKFGKWYSIVWMDKVIREKLENPKAFVPFSQIN